MQKVQQFFPQGFISSIEHSHKHTMLACLASATIVDGIMRVVLQPSM
jgi:hypothetical protein